MERGVSVMILTSLLSGIVGGCREAARRERLAGEAESLRQLRGGGGRPGSREGAEVLMRKRVSSDAWLGCFSRVILSLKKSALSSFGASRLFYMFLSFSEHRSVETCNALELLRYRLDKSY
jgi:hypothetical protein